MQRRLAADLPLQRTTVSELRMSAGSRRLRATAHMTRRRAVPFPSARALQADTLSLNLGPAARPTPAGGADGGRQAPAQALPEDQRRDGVLSRPVGTGAAAAAAQGAGAVLPGLAAAAPHVAARAEADARTLSPGASAGAASDRRTSPLASAVLSLMQVRAATSVVRLLWRTQMLLALTWAWLPRQFMCLVACSLG